jgi:hypothetical protein
MEFTTDRFGNMSLSPEGNDSGVVFIRMVHSKPPSVHASHVESFDEGNIASNGGGSTGLLGPRGYNVVTPITSITTTLSPENTPALLTIPMVPLQTTTP